MFFVTIVLLPLVLVFGISASFAGIANHPYGPHDAYGKQFFEGWYTRITADTGMNVGVIFGSFNTSRSDAVKSTENGNLVSLIFKDNNSSSPLSTVDWHPSQLVIDRCDGHPCFTVSSSGDEDISLDGKYRLLKARMSVKPDLVSYDISYSRVRSLNETSSIHIDITNHTMYSSKGPEGMFSKLGPLLPLHWYVYSVNSQATVEFSTSASSKRLSGHAHLEKNWGRSFPNQWTWAQLNRNDVQLALAGGDLGFPSPILNWLKPYLFAYRSQRVQLTFYPEDYILNPLKVQIHDTTSERSLRIKGSKMGIGIEVYITAPRSSFAKVQCPTRRGFMDYSIESYSARVYLRLFQSKTGVLIEEHVFDGGALEFGGAKFMGGKENMLLIQNT